MADLYAVVWALVFMGLGLGLVWVAKRFCGLESTGTVVAIIFAPLILFLILSGRVAEFGGGGISAKFHAVADKRLTATFPLVELASGIDDQGEPVTGEDIVYMGGGVPGAMAFLGGGAQVVFLDVSDAPDTEELIEKTVRSLATKIYFSLLRKSFLGLLVTDGEKVIGCFQRQIFYDLLRIELIQNVRGGLKGTKKENASNKDEQKKDEQNKISQEKDSQRKDDRNKKLKAQLRQTMLWDIVIYPRERLKDWGSEKTLHAYNTTNLEALRIFLDTKAEVMPLVDGQRRFVGMVTWEDLVSTLLVATSPEKPSPEAPAEKNH